VRSFWLHRLIGVQWIYTHRFNRRYLVSVSAQQNQAFNRRLQKSQHRINRAARAPPHCRQRRLRRPCAAATECLRISATRSAPSTQQHPHAASCSTRSLSAHRVFDSLPESRWVVRRGRERKSWSRSPSASGLTQRERGREGRDGGQGRRGAGVRPCSPVRDQRSASQGQGQRPRYGPSQRCQGH